MGDKYSDMFWESKRLDDEKYATKWLEELNSLSINDLVKVHKNVQALDNMQRKFSDDFSVPYKDKYGRTFLP